MDELQQLAGGPGGRPAACVHEPGDSRVHAIAEQERATCLAAVDDAIGPVGLWHVHQRVGFVGLRVVVVVVIAADVVVAVVPE